MPCLRSDLVAAGDALERDLLALLRTLAPSRHPWIERVVANATPHATAAAAEWRRLAAMVCVEGELEAVAKNLSDRLEGALEVATRPPDDEPRR